MKYLKALLAIGALLLLSINVSSGSVLEETKNKCPFLALEFVEKLRLKFFKGSRDDSLTYSQLQAIINSSNDAIITIDNKMIIIGWNPAATSMFGHTESEAVGHSMITLLPKRSHKYHVTQAGKAHPYYDIAASKKMMGGVANSTGKQKDGAEFPIEISLATWKDGDQIMYSAIIRDRSESQRLNRQKAEFIATMNHELKTPLTTMMGSLGLLKGGKTTQLSDKAKKLVTMAYKNSERLLMLVNDLLDFQKLQAGRMSYDMKKHKLSSLLELAVENDHSYATRFGVDLKFVNTGIQGDILIDVNRFNQVMSNLVSNAVKYSKESDQVEITLSRHDKFLRVSVIDHGEGIPEDFKSQIFGKFTQSKNAGGSQKAGTGLGLAITKTMVEEMGGKIHFTSKENIGTTFYVDFPEIIHQ
ncbi:MAG: PAS domain S-box protein [Bacteriovoracaceae bacterium]|nr:PAS domain S-box protein [Bacteriovoracaceae bacterium]